MTSTKRNFFYQSFYQILQIILPLLTSPYIARVLGASNLGIFSYTHTTASYFMLFALLGVAKYGNREVSRVRDDPDSLSQTASSILALHMITGGIVTAVYLVFAFTAPADIRPYSLICTLYVISALFDISWLFFGLEKFKLVVIRNTVVKVASVAAIFLFVRHREDLWIYIFIMAFTQLLIQLNLWLYIKGNVTLVRVNRRQIMSHLPQMLILFIPAVAISLYNYMDKIMLKHMSGFTQGGFYENSERIIQISTAVMASVGTVLMPKMSNIVAKGEAGLEDSYIRRGMLFEQLICAPITCGLIGIAPVFAPVFWGEEFTACTILIVFLAVTLPFKGFADILRSQYMIPHRMDLSYTVSVCAGAAVNLALNLLLIPRYQALGAVYGTIAAEVCVCLVQTAVCHGKLPLAEYLKGFAAFYVPAALMGGIVYLEGRVMPLAPLTLIIQVLTGVAVFSLLAGACAKVTRNDVILEAMSSFRKAAGRFKH